MCSGRVDMEFVIHSFLAGMDGVFVGACRLGECNYVTHGNYHALNMVHLCKRLLESVNLNPDRLAIGFMSAGDGILFAEIIDDFIKKMKNLGPLGVREGVDAGMLRDRLTHVHSLIPYIKLAMNDKLARRMATDTDPSEFFTIAQVEELIANAPSYYIDPEKCQACMICLRKCPVDAIEGKKKQIHVIDQSKCIKCGTCFSACPSRFGAVQKLVGLPVPAPMPPAERSLAGANR